MISMATPTILSAIDSEELSKYAVIFLILILSAVEIFNANSDIRNRFAPFMEISNAIIIPLLSVLAMITITKVIKVLM